jgi:hypothetical protein
MRELKGSKGGLFTPTPKVMLSEKIGNSFTGIIKDVKPTQYGPMYIFAIVSTDAPIKIKGDNEAWNEVDAKEGDLVILPGAKQLKDKLSEATVGEKITVVFNGKVLNPKSGQKYEDYKVTAE